MNPNIAQMLVCDHIRELHRQAAASRRGGAARGTQRKPATHAPWRGVHRLRSA